MALFFGLQSLQAYAIFGWFAQLWRDSGYSATTAGALAGLVAGTSIPLSLWLPNVLARTPDSRRVLYPVIAAYPIGYVGLMVAPYSLAPLWAVLVGVGTVTFPLILTLVGLRAHTPEGTAALSAFTQSTGYLIAAAGPFAVGPAARRHRRLDGAAVAAAGVGAAAVLAGGVRRQAAVRRGPARRQCVWTACHSNVAVTLDFWKGLSAASAPSGNVTTKR